MTVAELIEKLQEYNEDWEVVVPGPDHSYRYNLNIYDTFNDDESEDVLVIE